MKKLFAILSLITVLTVLNFISLDQTTHTVATKDIKEVKIGAAEVEINDNIQHVTYSNNENTLAFIETTDYKTVTIQESKTLLGQTKYHVIELN